MSMNRRALILVVLLSMALVQVAYAQGEAEIDSLALTVYPDGSVAVSCGFKVNPEYPKVNLTAPGLSVEDLVVEDAEGNPLDYEVLDDFISVDTLGADYVKVSYVTQKLTSKTGDLWTLSLNTTIPATIVLPEKADIVSLNTVPDDIRALDGKTILVMPAGYVEVSYTVSITGTREYAQAAILSAEEAISKAEAERRTVGLQDAKVKLKEAEKAFTQGRYAEASRLAEEAKELADKAVTPTAPPAPVNYAVIGATIIATIAILTFLLKKRKPKTASSFYGFGTVEVDLEKVYGENPDLRLEDREALKFLAEKGGVAFESEIREKLNLPRTSIWRLIKRLEKREIVTVQKFAGQNLIRISKKYEK